MSLAETLRRVIESLDEAGIEHMVTGSMAGAYHGTPRSTKDIDLVVDGTEAQFIHFAQEIAGREFYVSEEAVRNAVRDRTQFNVIDQRAPWKADLILLKDRDFSRVQFSRRIKDEGFGVELWIATAEDVILSKLEWASLLESERQLEDVIDIVQSKGADLDRDYLFRWAQELGVEQLWTTILDKI